MVTDIPLRTPDQAAKTATRHNRKLAKRFPLLAYSNQPIPGQWTPESVLTDEQRWRSRMDTANREIAQRGKLLRSFVAQRVSENVLAAMDSYFQRVLPQDDPAYAADYWFKQLTELCPERAWEMCGNLTLHRYFQREGQVACPTCHCPLTTATETW